MNPTYRITLVHLTADASAVAPASERLDLPGQSLEDIVQLAERMLRVDTSVSPKTEPGIIVHRSDRSYRIAVHQGRLRMHKSISLFDDYWTTDTPGDLGSLPPFQATPASGRAPARGRASGGRQTSPLRSVLEVIGLFAVAVLLLSIGLRFGFPQKRINDVPADVIIVTSSDERAAIFAKVAGSYTTGPAAGNTVVTIRPDGQVLLGAMGRDGKPTGPRVQESARAGRQGNIACVVTSFGVIAGIEPPDAVNVGRFRYQKSATAIQ